MKSWKTTLIGAGGAVIILLVQYFSKGGVDLKTIAEASLFAGLGYMAGDAMVEEAIKESPIATNVLALLDKLSGSLAESQPANPLLVEAHALLQKLTDNIAALPDAVAAAVPAPPDNTEALTNLAGQVDAIHQVVTNPPPVAVLTVTTAAEENAPEGGAADQAPTLKLPGQN